MQVAVSERPLPAMVGDLVVGLYRARGRTTRLPFADHLRADAVDLLSGKAEVPTWLETRRMKAPRALLACLDDPELAGDGARGGRNGSLEAGERRQQRSHELRVLGATVERACAAHELGRVILAAAPEDFETDDLVDVVEGMLLRAHDARQWRGDDPESSVTRLTVAVPAGGRRRCLAALRERVRIAEATNWSRRLADLPGNLGTPARVCAKARARCRSHGLAVHEIGSQQARALGMGLFAAVDQGASARGRILVIEHRPARMRKGDPMLALVGKGVTHDTGGYNLKTTAALHELTYDKCGATAVIGAMIGIAELGLDAWVIGICPLVENSLDAGAYKPGDILHAYDGRSVYVENTDAEGRLILADCLAWLAKRRPALVIDVATLTGAAHAALGEPFAAMFSNDSRARELVLAAADRSDDLVWPMPIDSAHAHELEHPKADVKNLGAAAGGACSAAAFLRGFVAYPWAHIDIAGKAHVDSARGYYGPGATGFGCRLLIHCARGFAEAHARRQRSTVGR